MKVRYNKGMGCPVEISDGETAVCISIDAAKELQASLLAVIEQAETPEEELTKFEQEVKKCVTKNLTTHIKYGNGREMSSTVFIDDDTAKKMAVELLDLARIEFIKDGYIIEKKTFHDAVEKIDEKHKAEMSVEYSLHCKVENRTRHAVMNWNEFQKVAQKFIDIGKAEALKDLPRWKKWGNGACGNGRGIPIALVVRGLNGYELIDALGIQGEKYIMLSDLEKLPGFKEDESHE